MACHTNTMMMYRRWGRVPYTESMPHFVDLEFFGWKKKELRVGKAGSPLPVNTITCFYILNCFLPFESSLFRGRSVVHLRRSICLLFLRKLHVAWRFSWNFRFVVHMNIYFWLQRNVCLSFFFYTSYFYLWVTKKWRTHLLVLMYACRKFAIFVYVIWASPVIL